VLLETPDALAFTPPYTYDLSCVEEVKVMLFAEVFAAAKALPWANCRRRFAISSFSLTISYDSTFLETLFLIFFAFSPKKSESFVS